MVRSYFFFFVPGGRTELSRASSGVTRVQRVEMRAGASAANSSRASYQQLGVRLTEARGLALAIDVSDGMYSNRSAFHRGRASAC